MSSRFQPGQTVRWCARLRADWVSEGSVLGTEPPVGRVLEVGIGKDPHEMTYCGVCGPPASRCPGPFVLVEFRGNEGCYAEHELEPA